MSSCGHSMHVEMPSAPFLCTSSHALSGRQSSTSGPSDSSPPSIHRSACSKSDMLNPLTLMYRISLLCSFSTMHAAFSPPRASASAAPSHTRTPTIHPPGRTSLTATYMSGTPVPWSEANMTASAPLPSVSSRITARKFWYCCPSSPDGSQCTNLVAPQLSACCGLAPGDPTTQMDSAPKPLEKTIPIREHTLVPKTSTVSPGRMDALVIP
mmetsp:Transcript_25886/g.60106  ORF Transcript_25886/g.60106 Transcript_25886/m.60106 type:complete len:211 (-) Transcript_25886:697-1329(-)